MSGEFQAVKQYEYDRGKKSGMIKPRKKVEVAKSLVGGEAKVNPTNELTRYHFYELIIRLACLKYGR